MQNDENDRNIIAIYGDILQWLTKKLKIIAQRWCEVNENQNEKK